jgi:hypothetical protein
MLKFIAAVIAAAAIAGVFTFQSAASARTGAAPQPVEVVADAAPQACTPQPWPYLTCAGASSVRLVTTDRLAQ